METVTLQVEGMTCEGCVRSVTRVLQGIAGVQSVEVSLEDARAQVQFDPTRTSTQRLVDAVQEAGYQARS
jgi:copper chaperone